MRPLSETDVRGLTLLHVLMRAEKPLTLRALELGGKVPAATLRSIVSKLAKAGLVVGLEKQRYRLAKAPGEIRLQDILEALDRREVPSAPCGGDFDACPSRATCVLAVLCRKADERWRETLREFTLEDLRDSTPDLPNCQDPAVTKDDRSVPSHHGARRHG